MLMDTNTSTEDATYAFEESLIRDGLDVVPSAKECTSASSARACTASAMTSASASSWRWHPRTRSLRPAARSLPSPYTLPCSETAPLACQHQHGVRPCADDCNLHAPVKVCHKQLLALMRQLSEGDV